jgi:rare lipoprotein A
LTFDALFGTKAQVPFHPRGGAKKEADGRRAHVHALEARALVIVVRAGCRSACQNRKCSAGHLDKTLSVISQSILRAFYKPSVSITSKLIKLPTVFMAPPALSLPLNAIRNPLSTKHGKALLAPLLALAFLCAMVWDDLETGVSAAIASMQTDANPGSVVLSLTHVGSSSTGDATLVFLADFDADRETCELDSTIALSALNLAAIDDNATIDHVPLDANPVSRQSAADIIFTKPGSNRTDLAAHARKGTVSKFSRAYRSVLKLVAMVGLPRIREEAALSRTTVIGTISTYNPYRDGKEEGSALTASGELYDPSAWTAAIQSGLRNQFGGVRYGRLYQPTYALVASGEKQLIVKINDVGPLKSGRVLDLNERSMRYFDPFLAQGLIQDVKITLLPGEDWRTGPVGEVYAIDFGATRQGRHDGLASEEFELANMRARLGHRIESDMKADARIDVRLSGG